MHFAGGFAGQPGPSDTFGNSTGYLAGQGQEILDHNITREFRYQLMVGKLDQIRARAAAVRPAGLPGWSFASDRQGWHYLNHYQTNLVMCDYASAGNGWNNDSRLRVWLPQPLFLRQAFPADSGRLMCPGLKGCPTVPKHPQ